jgi:hypothetical protein
VAVLAGSGVLVLEHVQLGDGAPLAPAAVLSSMRMRLGMHVPSRLEDLARRVAALERSAKGR